MGDILIFFLGVAATLSGDLMVRFFVYWRSRKDHDKCLNQFLVCLDDIDEKVKKKYPGLPASSKQVHFTMWEEHVDNMEALLLTNMNSLKGKYPIDLLSAIKGQKRIIAMTKRSDGLPELSPGFYDGYSSRMRAIIDGE